MMPNPKWVRSQWMSQGVTDAKGGAVEFRVEKAGLFTQVLARQSSLKINWRKMLTAFLQLFRRRAHQVQRVLCKKITLTQQWARRKMMQQRFCLGDFKEFGRL